MFVFEVFQQSNGYAMITLVEYNIGKLEKKSKSNVT